MSNKPMLSILTNFGCHFACSYCIYRENGIKIPKTDVNTFGWDELEEQLKIHRGECVSVSGGGDPLYQYGDGGGGEAFFNRLFELLKKYDCRLELHTSIVDRWFPYEECERVVFHFTMPNQINNLYWRHDYIELPSKVRIVYVVQEHYTKHLVQDIVKQVSDHEDEITELSFRQMIDKNGNTTYYLHDYLKEGHKKDWYYIEQADYHILRISGGVHGEKDFLIDSDMVEKCKEYKWYIGVFKKYKELNKAYCYAYTSKGLLLHRVVMNCTDKTLVVDHINGDTQDNRRASLQICSGTQNLMKQGFSDANKSGHKGVLWYHYNNVNKWVAYISANKKRKTLGYFDNIEDAIAARLKAEKEYFDSEFMPLAHTE